MFDKKEKSASAINWDKVEAEHLKMQGYTTWEIAMLQSIDSLQADELKYFFKQYIHMSAMDRKKLLREMEEQQCKKKD